MIVSHEHRFIFLKTRKTAGSSLEVLLSRFCGPDDIVAPLGDAEETMRAGNGPRNYMLPFWRRPLNAHLKMLRGKPLGRRWTGYYEHMTAKAVRRMVGENVWASYYKISSERNPWDRQVSLYYWRTRDMKERPTFEQFLHGKDRRAQGLGNFEIYGIGGKVVANDVILFHDMQNGIARVFDRLGLAISEAMPEAKTKVRPKRDYQCYYTDETRDLVGRLYAREIAAFGFSFEDASTAAP